MQNKNLFEIILHARRTTSLRSWVAKKIMRHLVVVNQIVDKNPLRTVTLTVQ